MLWVLDRGAYFCMFALNDEAEAQFINGGVWPVKGTFTTPSLPQSPYTFVLG